MSLLEHAREYYAQEALFVLNDCLDHQTVGGGGGGGGGGAWGGWGGGGRGGGGAGGGGRSPTVHHITCTGKHARAV